MSNQLALPNTANSKFLQSLKLPELPKDFPKFLHHPNGTSQMVRTAEAEAALRATDDQWGDKRYPAPVAAAAPSPVITPADACPGCAALRVQLAKIQADHEGLKAAVPAKVLAKIDAAKPAEAPKPPEVTKQPE